MCFNLRYIAFKKSNLQWKSVEKCDSSLWEIIPLNSWFWQQTLINNKVTFTIAVQLFGLHSVEKAANARKIC